jgi:hypothetical protein
MNISAEQTGGELYLLARTGSSNGDHGTKLLQQNRARIICMGAGINIPELSLSSRVRM